MRLQRGFAVAVLAAAVCFTAAAQTRAEGGAGRPGGRGMRGPWGESFQNLNLTDDQKAQLRTQMDNQRQQIEALRSDTSLTPEQRRAKSQEIMKSGHEQFLAILTPEQRTQLENDRKQGRGARGGRPAGPDGRGPGHDMAGLPGINLTDEQKTQLRTIHEQTKQQAQTIEQNTSLSDVQKKDQLRQLHANAMKQAHDLLTPEQQQQLAASMRNHRGRGPARRGPPPTNPS